MGNYEKAEGILDSYAKGDLSAAQAQKKLKGFGYKADLRGKSNTIPVYPIDGGDGFDVELAKGGAMLNKQMELFEPVEGAFDEGGLLDEGGSVDPVSGNDVPVGSTQQEVRDDIPAQLSEGEFVLPADVVRYHGLEKIMELRDEAKAGLQKMEAMGQMGNSEEATLPDDVPFSMDDLEMEDDGIADYQVGGFVPPSNIGFQQSQFAGYQPQIAQPVTQPSTVPTYQAPTQQFTPTQTGPVPSFATFTQPTSVTYYHADGRTIQVPVDASGNPLIPVPAGFSATKPAAAAPTTPTTTTPTYQPPAQQQDDSGPSPEQLQQQEEYKQTVNKRMEAAEELGYTKKQNALEAVLPFVVPGGGLLMGNPERGTVLVDGTIADGSGGSFDPISGEKVGSAGGILGNIATALGVGKKEEISEAASQMGVSPASIEGLKTIKGEESIQALLDEAGKTTTPSATVETARVTEEGAAGEVAQKAADIQSALDLADISEQEKIDFLQSVAEGKPVTQNLMDRTGREIVFTPAETPEAMAAESAAAKSIISDIQDRAKAGEFADTTRRDTAQAAGDTQREAARKEQERQAAIETERFARASRRTDEGSARREATVSGHAARYESQGYSPSAARSAAVNKTDADNEARQQTGNPKSTAVTSSSGKAVRSSSGSVVTNTPPDDSDSGGEPCVIATHGLSTGGFSLLDKAKAELWCEKTYHGKWYGEAFRRGYRYHANRAVQKGIAHEYYTEFKNFVACGRGLRKDIKSKVNYYIRTIQFFVTGLFVK